MRHLPIILLTVGYLVLGTLYIVQIPDWQSPDEPAHYNYIRQLADGESPLFPLMEQGDYDQSYQGEVVGSCFDPRYDVTGHGFEYEDYQPPLYYLMAVPLYKLGDGTLEMVRFTSLLMGAGTLIFAWAISRHLFPNRRWIALTIASFVAFLPQHLSIMASVNNDALAELLVAAMLYLLIVRRPSHITYTLLGILLGLAFLTKITACLMAGVIAVALLLDHWENKDWERLIKQTLRIFAPAILIGLLWWVRNMLTYPGFDFLGIQVHNRVVLGQMATADFINEHGLINYLSHFRKITFGSFWGQFGWMAQRFDSWMFGPLRPIWRVDPLRLVTVTAVIGAIWRLVSGGWLARSKRTVIILTALLALNCLLYITYNVQFVQHQGRYLFTSLIPIGVAGAAGLFTVLGDHIGRKLIPIGLLILLLGLNLVALHTLLPLLHYANC